MKKIGLFLHIIIFQCYTALPSQDNPYSIKPKKTVYLRSYITMDQAVQQALEHRPDLEALTYAVQANRQAAHSVLAGHYPTINLNTTFSQVTGQKDFVNVTSLSTNQLIYSFSGPLQLYKKAKKVTDISRLDKQIQANNIRFQVEIAFLQAFILQENDQAIKSTAISAVANFEKSEADNTQQLIDKNVRLKNTESYESTLSTNDQFFDDLANAYRTLEFLMGKSVKLVKNPRHMDNNTEETYVSLRWRPKKKLILLPLTTYYNYAIKHRPEIPQGYKRAAIEHDNIRLAQGQRLPSFLANAQAGFQGAGVFSTTTDIIPSSKGQGFYSVSASGSWSIFDGLVTQYQEQQARANRMKELLGIEQLLLNIKQDVQNKYYALSKALTQLKAQKISYVRARNDFILSKQQYDIGQIALYEFKTAQSLWEREKYNWIARNVDVALREAELMFVCGYPEIKS